MPRGTARPRVKCSPRGKEPRPPGRPACRAPARPPARPARPARRHSDVPLKEFLLALNEQQPPVDRFVLSELDDTHLYIKEKHLTFVERK